jgi:hypothetical protein
MKVHGGVDVQIHIFLTSALVGSKWSASHACCFIPKERSPGTYWIDGLVCPRAGVNDVEKLKSLDPTGT